MKKVLQRHSTACAVASIAMLTNTPYDKVLKLMHPKRKKGQPVPTTIPMDTVNCLIALGKKFRLIASKLSGSSKTNIYLRKKLRQLKHNAYVSVFLKGDVGHAVAWDATNKKIMDPSGKNLLSERYIHQHYSYILEILD